MTNLFISYRRSDSEGYAGRLYDQLIRIFDPSNVFMDVDSIVPGSNFVNVLNETLAKTDVMLVVIGSTWLTASDEKGRRRLDQLDDFVLQEIAIALGRDIAVIPVLVGKTEMPSDSDLPEEIAGLAARNAIWLRHDSFGNDAKRLIAAILNLATEFLANKTRRSIREFEEAIIEDFDNVFVFNEIGDDPRIRLYYASNEGVSTLFHSHLLKDAIVYLIESADVSGWMKLEKELQPHAFWLAILKSVAASYRLEVPYSTEDQSDFDLLRQLLSELERI